MSALPKVVFVFVAVLAFAAAAAAAPVVFARNGPASLMVDAPRERGEIVLRFADVLTVILEVEGDDTLEITAPAKITDSEGWHLLDTSPTAVTEVGGKRRRWRRSYVFEPLLPGSHALQIQPLQVSEGKQPLRKLGWPAIPVQVMAARKAELKDLRDPTVIEPVVAPDPGSTPSWVFVAATVGATGVALLAFRKLRKARPAPLPPAHRAMRELERLRALRLPESGKFERFYTLLANVLRRYLERKFNLPARRRTTAEFLNDVRSSEHFSVPQRNFLGVFLAHCDLAKFAGAHTSPEECATLADEVRAFIRATQSEAR